MTTELEFLTTAELATLLRAPEATVRYWRHTGYGPAGILVGRRVLYSRAEVNRWIAEQRMAATA